MPKEKTTIKEKDEKYDLTRLMMDDDIKTIDVEGVGKVSYKPFTALDMSRLSMSVPEGEDDVSFGFRVAHFMIQGANPEITYDMWCKMKPKAISKIMNAVLKDSDFLGNSSDEN